MPKLVDHDERRRQIAEALLEIAGTRGLHAATMREVAAQAGVSVRLVQYYFTSKDALLAGALAHLTDRLSQRVRDHAGPVDDLGRAPREVITGVLSALLPTDPDGRKIILSYHAYYAFALSEGSTVIDRGAADAARLEDFLAGQVSRAQELGQIPAGRDPALTAAGLLAIANGLAISMLTGRRDGPAALAALSHHLDGLFSARPAA